jgi:transcriptional regulator GlxA family with amidase domain
MISQVTTGRPAVAQHLRDLTAAPRMRPDRPGVRALDVEALARGASMAARQLSRQFRFA